MKWPIIKIFVFYYQKKIKVAEKKRKIKEKKRANFPIIEITLPHRKATQNKCQWCMLGVSKMIITSAIHSMQLSVFALQTINSIDNMTPLFN